MTKFQELKKMSSSSVRGRYHLNNTTKKLIESAINGVGSWVLCSDIKNATYEKVKIRELIREHYTDHQAKLKISIVGNTIFIWNKKLYGINMINEKTFNTILRNGKMALSSKYELQEREKDLSKLGDLNE